MVDGLRNCFTQVRQQERHLQQRGAFLDGPRNKSGFAIADAAISAALFNTIGDLRLCTKAE
jgi:hypothetical protein